MYVLPAILFFFFLYIFAFVSFFPFGFSCLHWYWLRSHVCFPCVSERKRLAWLRRAFPPFSFFFFYCRRPAGVQRGPLVHMRLSLFN